LDTKLRNYDGAKKWGCLLAGIGFVAVGLQFADKLSKLFRIYDLHYLCMGLVFESEGAYEASAAYETLAIHLSELWKETLLFGLVMIVLLVLACVFTGGKITWFDKIFTDIQVVLFSLAATGTAWLSVMLYENIHKTDWMERMLHDLGLTNSQLDIISDNWGVTYLSYQPFEPPWLEAFAIEGALVVLLGICLLFFLSWVKKMKAGCFWRSTLVGWLVLGIRDAIRESKGVQGKIIGVLIIGAILSATWIGLIAVLVFIIFFVPKQIKKYLAIRNGVAAVKEGDLDYKISTLRPGEKPGELDRLAMDINEISAATSIAVANELKNQRMKTDLISNVSHDLKTPLTSMVSYVDLLKTEGMDSPQAPEYLDIIDEKTRRLQKLTEDLFEAAKASSGSIPVNMERIDMHSIMGQALAEVGGRLEAADLDVIFADKTCGEGAFVMADGQLLWRVMENLLVNAGKYALPGSRVYIDVSDRGDGYLLMEMKNMSRDRLNIDADELMERFKRGDESRNTEGSGLGLAIAKDLVALMEGEFGLTIDGDLFKVSVAMKRA